MEENKVNILKKFWVKLATTFTALVLLWGVISIFTFSNKDDEATNDKKYLEDLYSKYGVYAIPLPENLSFANEKVPIEYFDVYENLDREFLINTYWHSQAFLYIKKSARYFPVIEPILKQYNVPDDFKYLCVAESGLTNVVSPAGASGFWQFMKSTGVKYGLKINDEIDERYNLEKSTIAACKYLKDCFAYYKNWTLVAASYNAGMGGIDNQIKKQKADTYYDLLLNDETSRYVYRIIAIKTIMQNPLNYGIHYRKKDLYPPIPTEKVIIDTTINDLVQFSIKNEINYKLLKYFNPWLRQNTLTVTAPEKYTIILPKKNYRNLKNIWLDYYLPDSTTTDTTSNNNIHNNGE